MNIASLVQLLENDVHAEATLRAWGVNDTERAMRNLRSLAASGLTLDLLADFATQLARELPQSSDADRVLNNLDRFVGSLRNPLAFGGLCERDTETLPTLLQIFSASQSLSEYLIRDPDAFDLVRLTQGQPTPREPLKNDIVREITQLSDERSQLAAIRRIKQRETLRIAYGDFVRRQSIAVVTRQISFLAEALVEAAVQCARRKFTEQKTTPRSNGQPVRFAVIALGKLGGEELNYSSDIDLVFICDTPAGDSSRRTASHETWERMTRYVVKLLAESTDLGVAYRVDLRLRPRGQAGAVVQTLEEMLHYYDLHGRTWERQAYVKARTIAGDVALGNELLAHLQPWVYQRYLNRADITGIKALKRRIEQRAVREGANLRDVKSGHGGLRDIEFVIQFLQLLNGGDLPDIRTGNTLEAIRTLERAHCLTTQEASLLSENYEFLRRVEHRLQIMYDLQTHALPVEEDDLRKLAIRMHYAGDANQALAKFQHDLLERTNVNRQILNHLLHSAFPDDPEVAPEVDLVLDPEPSAALVDQVLAKYGFHNTNDAFHYLVELSSEKIPFLSTRRCRHFLAAIAPALLTAVAATPNPDHTLRNLARVSESLGGKGVLWELFSFNPPTLHLYVQLCAASPYLSDLLVGNPGMIDELLDSLLLDKLPNLASLHNTLGELCRGAEDLDPILLSFKHSMHLRVGVRDILGKDEITSTHNALSDIMEAILHRVAEREFERLVEKHGEPILTEGPRTGQRSELLLVALGKLGGREPNYHSDCDVLFLYEGEGMTRPLGKKKPGISNQHFFGQLAQRIVKDVTKLGPYGKLFEMDARLRPAGQAGPLAISLTDFIKYHTEGLETERQAELWERQALCKARVVYGSELARIKTQHLLRQAILSTPWKPEFATEIFRMRERMESGASPRNLKRGPGGTVDVEFVVQMCQLKYALQSPSVLATGTLDALKQLAAQGHMPTAEAHWWAKAYLFLRRVESGLRLLNTTDRHDLPTDAGELQQLAFLLGMQPAELETQCLELMQENRQRFLQHFQRESELQATLSLENS
jgi:glutamate-ammonia-ligase adenylyltransferase